MKKIKKILACIFTFAMILTMTTNVFGASDGEIVINSVIQGETYKIYKVFDATTQGENVAYSYTKAAGEDELYNALTAENSPFTLTATAEPNFYIVTLKEGVIGSEISVFLKSIEGKLGVAVDQKTATTETVEFDGLEYGLYYISRTATEGAGPTVGVTSVTPRQEIVDKSTKPGPVDPTDPDNPDPDEPYNPGGYKVLVDKDGNFVAESNTANYGDEVNFVLQSKATNYNEAKKIVEYTAYDLLGEGFDGFAVDKVTVNDVEINNYTVDTSVSPYKIVIPWVNNAGEHLYAASSTIKVYCSAVVGENAVIGGTGNNTTNTGWFGWKYDTTEPNPEDPTGPEIPEKEDGFEDKTTVTTKVYAIAINKTDVKGNALEGAEFEVYKDSNVINVSLVTEGDDTNASVYKYDATSTNTTVISPASGKIIIKGVEGVEYAIRETVAPAGYNLLQNEKTITATEFASSTTTMTLYYDADGNLTDTETETTTTVTFDVASAAINIINQSGTELPTTGGMGTTLFYMIGTILVVGASILLVTKKRMKKEA